MNANQQLVACLGSFALGWIVRGLVMAWQLRRCVIVPLPRENDE